jgi:hypothetical protein
MLRKEFNVGYMMKFFKIPLIAAGLLAIFAASDYQRGMVDDANA